MGGNIRVRHFCSVHAGKAGNNDDEYEDACAGNNERQRFGIADGATDSSFADVWAKQLVEGFVSRTSEETHCWSKWLPALQKEWADVVDSKALPFFAVNKAQKGAFATFLGLTFHEKCWFHSTLYWHALAVGDACLFLIRGGKCHEAFPVSKADDFNNSPHLIGSRPTYSTNLSKSEMRREGICYTDDVFWMMTDAISHWFLKELEANRKPWRKLEPFLFDTGLSSDFSKWLADLRLAKEIRNDDVTVMRIAF